MLNSRSPASRTPSSRPFGEAVLFFRSTVTYVATCVTVISRTVSLNRQISNFVRPIMTTINLIYGRLVTTYVSTIVTVAEKVILLRRRLSGLITKRSTLTGSMRRRR